MQGSIAYWVVGWISVHRITRRIHRRIIRSDSTEIDCFDLHFFLNAEVPICARVKGCETLNFPMTTYESHWLPSTWNTMDTGNRFEHPIWCNTLKWPSDICNRADYKCKDDWGVSWLELFFNFCLCTRKFFPIRIEGRKKDSVYIDFHSKEAMLNFGKKRAANMQTLCMERLIRTLEKLQQVTLFPKFQSNQCKSLMRFGYTGKHTGVPCRPLMQKQQETMEWVRKFLVKARYEGHLGQTPILPDGQAIIDFPPLVEKDSQQRWAMYFQIKGKQRRDRIAQEAGA